MEIIIALVALLVGVVVGFLLARGQKGKAEAQVEMLNQIMAQQKAEADKDLATEREVHREAMEQLKAEAAKTLADEKEECRQNLEAVKAESRQAVENLKAEQQQRLREQEERHRADLEKQMALITEQLKNSTSEMLKNRSAELQEHNKEQLSQILNPLQMGLKQMQEEVEKNRSERSETMERLKAVIDTTMAHTKELGERADNLANALTRDNKYQGNFGELRLSKMLEDMGFERGLQFEEQVTLRDEEGYALKNEESEARMQPDVILHFPDNRDIIIDSKVSMTAFERWANAKDEEEKKAALKEHVASVRNQVKLLTQKSYWKQYNQKGVKLDFVVMFMFSESALQLALTEDPLLWNEAYGKGVLITGGQNLYALLRILEISWKHMAQVENQESIIDCANEMVGRVQLFYERFLSVEAELAKTQTAFNNLRVTVAPSGPSIITSANKLLKYGAKEDPRKKKSLPKAEPEIEQLPAEDVM